MNHALHARRTLLTGGLLIGIGMGGFLDGIVLHQILQWHNMLSSVLPPGDLVNMKVNMFWDGLFHAFTWVTTFVGVALMWRAGKRGELGGSNWLFGGSLVLGWGVFNLVEGVIDHQILGVHHVRPGATQLAWDVGFLLFALVLMAGGGLMIRSGGRDVAAPRGAYGQGRGPADLATPSPR